MKQSDERSKLQERLAAELQDKLRQRPMSDGGNDKLEDSSFLKDRHHSSPFAILWIIVTILVLIVLGVSVYMVTR